ncbi:MAG TPA: hypothetical protein VFY75_01215 [Solirubrobacterales bacterium]|nr:hypothetical protein [Solirubrobacterales bacterium]
MRRKFLLLVLSLAVGAIALGCGDSGDDSTASLTKAEYIKQANAICAKYTKQMAADFLRFSKENRDQQNNLKVAKEGIAEITVEPTKEEIEDLRALPVPSGEEEKVEALLVRREEALEKIEKEPLFKVSGDPFEAFNKPLHDYGLTECAL